MIKCPKCNKEIPEDSMFCPRCGSKIPKIKPNICRSCGAEVPDDSSFCPFCGTSVEKTIAEHSVAEEEQNAISTTTQKNKKQLILNFKTVSVVLLVIALALGALSIYLSSNINGLDSEIDKLSEEKSQLSGSVSDLKTEVQSLEKCEDYYDDIVWAANHDNIGYAAYNFHCDTGVVVLRSYGFPEKVTLTAYWSCGGTVSTSVSDKTVADIDFDNNNWSQSTTLTVSPYSEGVSVVTFSNNVDSHTFKLIIIVR